jgi:protein-S-isoprenylcysteine O-methyltransferase Ste14
MSGTNRVRRTGHESSLPSVSVGTGTREETLREEFHREYDVGYVAPGLPRPTFKQGLKHYLASALVYGSVLLLYTFHPWFGNLLGGQVNGVYPALVVYYHVYAAYLILAPAVFLLWRPQSLWASKNVRIVGYLWRAARGLGRQASRDLKPTYEEKHALMFLLIKIIYAPWMISSFMNEYASAAAVIPAFAKVDEAAKLLRISPTLFKLDAVYELMYHAVFVIDSAIFMFGYHWEAGFLRNKLRYTETNLFHILVCLACYGPFNLATSQFFGTSNQSVLILWHGDIRSPVTWVLRGLAMCFMLLLLSSSLSMATRASNLTNRGIVTWGPYAIVRHPGYFAKNMFWLMTLIPMFVPNNADPTFTWPAYLMYSARLVWGAMGWGMLYFLRAITEERLLMRDPDYVAYCKKVRYRFIRWVY